MEKAHSPKSRIERAWESARSWITEFTGEPMVALFVNTPRLRLLPGLQAIAAASETLRITAIPADRPVEPAFISIKALAESIETLYAGTLAELSANWDYQNEQFALDLHLIIHPVGSQTAALELDWWSDQVFSNETDNPAQFAALLEYLIAIQKQFASPGLFLGSERGLDPDIQDGNWVEV